MILQFMNFAVYTIRNQQVEYSLKELLNFKV